MIDSTQETVLSLAHATNHIPRRRAGRKTHVSTLFRWTTAGCRGIVLESIQVGGTRCTSLEALQRFFERLSSPQCGHGTPDASFRVRTPTRRKIESEAAGKRLEQMGA